MKKLTLVFSGCAALTLLAGAAALAHHSFTEFDRDTEIVTTGTVVRWEFNNPHSWLRMNIPNADGTQTLWSFEGSGPTSLIQRGITGATFEPGDTVTLMYCKMRDGRNGGHMGWAKLADGSFVAVYRIEEDWIDVGRRADLSHANGES